MILRNQSNDDVLLRNQSDFISTTPDNLSGCVAYFNFNNSGTYIYDTRNIYSGLVIGSFNFVGGRIESGLNCMGNISENAGSVVILNTESLQISGPLTISMWLYPLSTGFRSNPLDKKYGGEYAITQEINGKLTFFNGSSASIYTSIQTTGSVIINNWNHFLVTRQQNFGENAGSAWVYLNGQLSKINSKIYVSGISVSVDNIKIGYGYTGSNYRGYIDELAIFNKVLSEVEIQELYQGGYPRFSTIKQLNNDLIIREVK